MRAVRYVGEDERIVLEEVDRPTIGPDDVRVAVRAASLCGSDLHYREAESEFSPNTVPVTLGHEGAGVVTETGEGVTAVAENDRVIVNYVASCGHCEPCLAGHDNRCRNRTSIGHDVDGTFAEEIVVPERCAVPMDGDVPFAWGSIVGCAGSTAFHAVERADVAVGDTVAVFGVGGVGMHAVLWASFRGAAGVIAIDPVTARREAAREYGADLLFDPETDDVAAAIAEATDGWGVDAAIECSGSVEALSRAVDAVDGRNRFESGTVVSVGLQETPLEATYWGLREGELLVSGDHTRAELRTIANLMAAGRIDLSGSVADRIDLSEIDAGLDRMAAGESVGRIVVEP